MEEPTASLPAYIYDLAKYPFLDLGAQYVRYNGYTMATFDDPAFSRVVDAARQKLLLHLQGQYDVKTQSTRDSVLTFLACTIVLRLVNDRTAINKFCMQEARRMEAFLEGEMSERGRRAALIAELYSYVLGVRTQSDPDGPDVFVIMRVTDYLMLSSRCSAPKFHLINQLVDRGWVHLEMYDALRLARETMAGMIRGRIIGMKLERSHVAKSLLMLASELDEKLSVDRRDTLGKNYNLTEEQMAPCARHCIAKLRTGENLGDAGRFFLANYLAAIGLDEDHVIDYFRNAPDFNERVTRYHVRRVIKSLDPVDAKPKVTGCEKLRNLGLCFPDPEKCAHIFNPMQYGRPRDGDPAANH